MSIRFERISAFFLLLAAFALRVFRLDMQSIWSDEGLSIYRASQDLAAIPELSAAGIHPPLYDLLLHFWMRLAGNIEFSTRFLSVFFGVLAVAAIFQLGRSVLGRGGAPLAALVAALAPFLVHYSQETRMYAPGLFFSVLSVVAALRWLRGRGSRAWVACYAASMAAAVYFHYYAWLVAGFINVFVLLRAFTLGKPARQRLAPWALAQAALALAYLPWAGVLLNKYETYVTRQGGSDPADILYQTVISFGLGYSGGQAGATPGQVDLVPDHWIVVSQAIALLALAVWGVASRGFPAHERGKAPVTGYRTINCAVSRDWSFLPLYLALPVISIILLSWGKRDFAPRYLLFAAPAYYLLIAQGISSLLGARQPFRIVLGITALLLVLGTSALSLRNYYYDPTYWRDDIRGAADFISSRSRNGDAVILNAHYLKPTFSYYYRGRSPVLGLPAPPPNGLDNDLASLEQIAGERDRVWLVLWQNYYTDPEGVIQGWLDEKAIPFEEQRFRGGITILGYLARPPLAKELEGGQAVGLKLGRLIELAAYDPPSLPVCAGEELPFTIRWRALGPVTTDYTVFVHLQDAEGVTWAIGDSQPVHGGFPTSQWPVGSVVADERWLRIPEGTPPGDYLIEVGMYDLTTMTRLGEGEPEPFQTVLGPVEVLPPGCR